MMYPVFSTLVSQVFMNTSSLCYWICWEQWCVAEYQEAMWGFSQSSWHLWSWSHDSGTQMCTDIGMASTCMACLFSCSLLPPTNPQIGNLISCELKQKEIIVLYFVCWSVYIRKLKTSLWELIFIIVITITMNQCNLNNGFKLII